MLKQVLKSFILILREILHTSFKMITYNYNGYGSDFPFTPSKYIKTNLKVLLKMLDGEDIKQYKGMILFKNAQQMFFKQLKSRF